MDNKFCITIEGKNNDTVDSIRFEVPVIKATNDINLDSNIGKLILRALNTGFRNMDRCPLVGEQDDNK